MDKSNPKYDEFKNKFKNLLIIEMGFKTDQYVNTTDLIKDVEMMLFQQYNLLAAAGSTDFDLVQKFQEFFKKETENLKDLPLVVPSGPVHKTVTQHKQKRPEQVKRAVGHTQ